MTDEQKISLTALISGQRSPQNGLEFHFLKVVSGNAIPCSPIENEWYVFWKKKPYTPPSKIPVSTITINEQVKPIAVVNRNNISVPKNTLITSEHHSGVHISPGSSEYYPTSKLSPKSDDRWMPCRQCGGDGGVGGRCPRCGGNGFES